MRKMMAATLLVFLWIPAAHAEKLRVIASFSILGDMVHEVAGDNVDLKTLVGPNGDAHIYEPTPADVKAVSHADLVVVNGLGFEGWLGRLVVSSGYTGEIVPVTRDITSLGTRAEGVKVDPHAWQSIANGKRYVIAIRDALIKVDSAHAADYRANAGHYLERLDTLETWVKNEIAKVPDSQRKLITSHDAFQYFAREYNVIFITPLGVSTESEASAADIAGLIDQIRAHKVKAVFMENIADPRLIRQLETDGGAYVGGTLYSDALSPPDGPAPTYIEMFHHNIIVLTEGMLHN